MKLVVALVLSASLVASIAACADNAIETRETSAPLAAPVSNSPSTNTPIPAAEPIAPSGFTAPKSIFDGDCETLFTTAEISDIAGAELATDFQAEANHNPVDQALIDAQGITCGWYRETGSTGVTLGIHLILVPTATVPKVARESCGAFTSGEGMGNTDLCLFDAEEHGVRIGGSVYSRDKAKSRAIADRLVSHFATAAARVTVPENPYLKGKWFQTNDCERLDPIDVGGESFQPQVVPIGTDGSSYPLQNAIMGTDYAFVDGCVIDIDGDKDQQDNYVAWNVQAPWRFDTADGGFEEVSVDGFDRVIRRTSEPHMPYRLLDGPNLLEISANGVSETDMLDIARELARQYNSSS